MGENTSITAGLLTCWLEVGRWERFNGIRAVSPSDSDVRLESPTIKTALALRKDPLRQTEAMQAPHTRRTRTVQVFSMGNLGSNRLTDQLEPTEPVMPAFH